MDRRFIAKKEFNLNRFIIAEFNLQMQQNSD